MKSDPRHTGPPRVNRRVRFAEKEIAVRCARLKRIRLKLRLTQKEFARRLGLKRPQYGLRETGKICPSDTEMILAELLNLLDNQKRARHHNKAYKDPAIKRKVISMFLRDGLTPEEIARALGIRYDIAVWHTDNLDFDDDES